jgi:hypothetical protein
MHGVVLEAPGSRSRGSWGQLGPMPVAQTTTCGQENIPCRQAVKMPRDLAVKRPLGSIDSLLTFVHVPSGACGTPLGPMVACPNVWVTEMPLRGI